MQFNYDVKQAHLHTIKIQEIQITFLNIFCETWHKHFPQISRYNTPHNNE